MGKFLRNSDGEWNVQVVVALIAAMATLAAALITGFFGLLQLRAASGQPPTAAPTHTPVSTIEPTATVAPLLVEIEGPAEAPLNALTYFTILSQNAVRAEWTIGGFAENRTFEVDPLPASHQIDVGPTNADRIGDTFTLVVTVYDDDDRSAVARHRFQVVADE
jgi:hypothetical protein